MLWGGWGGAWRGEGFFVPGGAAEIPGGERCGGSWSCLMNGGVLWGRKEGKRGKPQREQPGSSLGRMGAMHSRTCPTRDANGAGPSSLPPSLLWSGTLGKPPFLGWGSKGKQPRGAGEAAEGDRACPSPGLTGEKLGRRKMLGADPFHQPG